jgi:hypothetical protein
MKDAIEASIDRKLHDVPKKEDIPSLWNIGYVVAGIALAAVTTVVAIVAYGGDRFSVGASIGTAIGEKYLENRLLIDEQRQRSDDRFRQIIERLDGILANKNQAQEKPTQK